MNAPPPQWFGWRMDGGHRPIAALMPKFRNAAPRLMAQPQADKDILLYKALTKVLGEYPPCKTQAIGDCVSFGHAHANDVCQCVEIAFGKEAEFRRTSSEFIYGAARKAGHMLGSQDGCYGSLAAKTMVEGGMIFRELLGDHPDYDGKRAKQWGSTGPPAELEQKALAYKLGNAALVSDLDDARAAIQNGYPITICTQKGFTMTRDEHGFCHPKGQWGHCMFVAGLRFGARPGACVVQSWGPNVPDGPLALDQPNYSFWIQLPVFEQILREGDSWALSGSPTYQERQIPEDESWTYSSAA